MKVIDTIWFDPNSLLYSNVNQRNFNFSKTTDFNQGLIYPIETYPEFKFILKKIPSWDLNSIKYCNKSIPKKLQTAIL